MTNLYISLIGRSINVSSLSVFSYPDPEKKELYYYNQDSMKV